MKKSFYTLEFFVQPGGARMSWLLITDKISTMKKTLEQYFLQDELHKSLYLLLSYGTSMVVQTYQSGERTQKINLVPFLTITFEGYLPASVRELQPKEDLEGSLVYFLTEKDTKNRISIPAEEFEDMLFQSGNEQWQWKVIIDWESILLEVLKSPAIDEFEAVELYENYLEKSSLCFMGLHNTEYGGYSHCLNWNNLFEPEYEDQEYYERELSANPEFCEKVLKEALAKLDLESFGFEWMTKEGSAEYSSDTEVQLARLEVGNETIFLNYDLEKKEYQLNCSFVFTIQAELTDAFFKTFTERYVKPSEDKFGEYGQYDIWDIKKEINRFRETVKNEVPTTIASPRAKTFRVSSGKADWSRMTELENTIVESKNVFVQPVCLASQHSMREEKISQFYTLLSASLVSIIARPYESGYEYSIETTYLPDPENHRHRGLSFYNESIALADLPLDLFETLRTIKSLENV